MVRVTFTERDRGDDFRHGTPTGARRHSKAGEPPCDACRAAKAEYDKRWRTADENTRKNRLHAAAQRRALRDLKNAHEDEYQEAYLRHKAALVAERIRQNGGA